MDRRIVIERENLIPDGGGGHVSTWSPVATVWGRLTALGARERTQAMQQQMIVAHRIVIRHRTDITAAMRARVEGRTFNIRAVTESDGRRDQSVLWCEEGVAT